MRAKYMRDAAEHPYTIDFQQDMIDVTSAMPYRDESWEYTDPNGHVHTWATYGDTWAGDEDTYWCGDCHDEHTDITNFRCRVCDAPVTGGTVTDTARRYIPGLLTVTLTMEVPDGGSWPETVTTDGYVFTDPSPSRKSGTWAVQYVGTPIGEDPT